MRKEFIIGLASIALVAGLTWHYTRQYQARMASFADQSGTAKEAANQNTSAGSTAAPEVLSADMVATHDVPKDCWISISGNVYDVSNFLNIHPGGAFRIIPYCGKDATAAFATKGGEGTHSSLARSELAQLRLGSIGQLVSESTVPPVQAPVDSVDPVVPTAQLAKITPVVQPGTVLTTATVAQHSTSGSCWIIISNTVYAVSGYLNLHPGGANRIIPYCGKDATAAFQTQGGTGSHSSTAYATLANYRIGVLNSDVSTQQIQNAEQAPAPAGAQRGDDDDEDDDD